MTKEIIIDGINVAECNFYKNEICNSPINTLCKICKNIKPEQCYFKQLQRLKQENEEIRKINNDLAETHKTIGQDLYKECVSLRSELTVQKEVAKAFCRGLEQTEKLLGKYKQALEEIRKYCEEQNLKADYTACEILTIIDEVSDEQF